MTLMTSEAYRNSFTITMYFVLYTLNSKNLVYLAKDAGSQE